ncbi:MAG: hypothetical protein PHS93_04900 [Candidatus Omnitrophica bacterium]|nr:hypothetical protein [Candidatus Omnitrophota bacterium]MDD5352490.1 hypothetical protein [Candidatus Omnitrophota bacterium]MDD5550088.1 hypothetical protein [Candidatus Omnitrophota bacterium]
MKFLLALLLVLNFAGCTTIIITKDRQAVSTLEDKIALARSLSDDKIYTLTRTLSAYINTEEDRKVLREEMIKRHPEWTPAMKALVEEGRIAIGMLEEQVLSSWGKPKNINKNAGPQGVFEQWLYGGGHISYDTTYYVYLQNGVVVSWQKNE